MSGRGLRLAIGLLGTAWALVGEGLAFQTGQSPSAGFLHLAIGLTYLYGGLAIWDHEPTNRTGALMTAVGLAWFIPGFAHSEIPGVNEVGLALEDTSTVLILALVLAYPSGRLTSMVDRAAVAILAIGATGLNVLFSTSLFKLDPGPTGLYGGLALATMATVVIVRRWLIAPARERRELLPVLVAGLVFLAILVINLVRRIADVPDDVGAVLIAARDLVPAAIPVALLIGFYRQSERRLRAVVDAIPDRMVRFDRHGEYLAGRDRVGRAGPRLRRPGRAPPPRGDVRGRRRPCHACRGGRPRHAAACSRTTSSSTSRADVVSSRHASLRADPTR